MSFIDELQWRGMIHDKTPGTEELFNKEKVSAYVGIDPTADSLHIGHLVSIMMLKHLQVAGHKPIALVGGATGMIGDPSGKSEERNLLSEEILRHNQDSIKEQLSRFLDFENGENKAELVNNYDWMKEFSFLQFLRDVGKHITINYMTAKDSVKQRMETGLSFTEFTYQLVQGYDFYYLKKEKNCKLQMGGSDQWGNITTGTELIRRMGGGEAYALTCPLITKSDGKKFGKTEEGNVWLDANRTSPYDFYQFWLNTSDEDAGRYLKIFTLRSKDDIESLIKQHLEAPHLRMLQKTLAEDVTTYVHGEKELERAIKASQILFGKSTEEELKSLDERTLLSALKGVPQYSVNKSDLEKGINIIEFLSSNTDIMPSKGEARKMVKGNGISLNKEKVNNQDVEVNSGDLINEKYLLVQRGKKKYFLIKVE